MHHRAAHTRVAAPSLPTSPPRARACMPRAPRLVAAAAALLLVCLYHARQAILPKQMLRVAGSSTPPSAPATPVLERRAVSAEEAAKAAESAKPSNVIEFTPKPATLHPVRNPNTQHSLDASGGHQRNAPVPLDDSPTSDKQISPSTGGGLHLGDHSSEKDDASSGAYHPVTDTSEKQDVATEPATSMSEKQESTATGASEKQEHVTTPDDVSGLSDKQEHVKSSDNVSGLSNKQERTTISEVAPGMLDKQRDDASKDVMPAASDKQEDVVSPHDVPATSDKQKSATNADLAPNASDKQEEGVTGSDAGDSMRVGESVDATEKQELAVDDAQPAQSGALHSVEKKAESTQELASVSGASESSKDIDTVDTVEKNEKSAVDAPVSSMKRVDTTEKQETGKKKDEELVPEAEKQEKDLVPLTEKREEELVPVAEKEEETGPVVEEQREEKDGPAGDYGLEKRMEGGGDERRPVKVGDVGGDYALPH